MIVRFSKNNQSFNLTLNLEALSDKTVGGVRKLFNLGDHSAAWVGAGPEPNEYPDSEPLQQNDLVEFPGFCTAEKNFEAA